MSRLFLLIGSVAAAVAVAAGAFGAHGLEGRVPPNRIDTFETGVTYHMYHALALLVVAWASSQFAAPSVAYAGYCFVAGILIFSGSLYLLVLTDTSWLGAITPIGGVAFIAGWLLLAYGVWSSA
jgi:uncharacterized membrane protein YgdD (TMEM256/DUF423 family)